MAADGRTVDRESALPGGIRIALHTGDLPAAAAGGEEPVRNPILSHARRILAAGHPGQILCSEATAFLIRHDLDPGERLVDLGLFSLRAEAVPERLFQLEWRGMPQREFPAPAAAAPHASHLPLLLTRFFGRRTELDQLRRWIAGDRLRLVTLLGPGGTGKTRLALEAAGSLLADFPGGVWFADLSRVTGAGLIGEVLCEALGVERSRSGDALDQALAALHGEPTLVILDNLEHLLPGAAATVERLRQAAPQLQILATSRMPLSLAGERRLDIRPLAIPGGGDTLEGLSDIDSVRLFVDRAQTVKPDFQITRRTAATVARLCTRLEGIPLAIELAAARAQVLAPAQMLTRLDRRLELLVSRRRDLEPRHRTMRAVLDWSRRLLAPDLRDFLARLSVFRGGFTVDAAEEICREPLALDLLEQLRECSLLQVEESSGEVRFAMLETIREYAAEMLGDDQEATIGDRHASYYLELKRGLRTDLRGEKHVAALARLDLELENLRAALDWCQLTATRGRGARALAAVRLGLELSAELSLFWTMRGRDREGLDRIRGFLACRTDGVPETLIAHATQEAGTIAGWLGEFDESMRLLERSLEMHRRTGQRQREGQVLNSIAVMTQDRGDPERARGLYEQVLAIARELGNEQFAAQALNNLGVNANILGDYEAAQRYLEESLALKRRGGTPREIANALNGLGNVAENRGDYTASRRYHEECLAIARELGDERMAAFCLANQSNLAAREGDSAEAVSLLRQSIGVLHRIGARHFLAVGLEMLGAIPGLEGREAWLTTVLGTAQCLRDQMGIRLTGGQEDKWGRTLDRLRAALGDGDFERHWQRGLAMNDAEAVAFAMGEDRNDAGRR